MLAHSSHEGGGAMVQRCDHENGVSVESGLRALTSSVAAYTAPALAVRR